MYAFLMICVFVNTIGARLLPKIEGGILILHTLGFFAVLIPLVYLSPHSTASFVFTEFNNLSGYKSNGLSWFIGLISANLPLVSYDGPCHMAEEIQNASTVVPWCMIATILLNGTLGLAIVLAFTFCLGGMDGFNNALENAPAGYDFIPVFQAATNNLAGTSVMSAILMTLVICASFGFLASASRQTWAFARDRGLPFSGFISQVHQGSALPLRAIATCTLITAIICLINVGSTVAFNAIVSLTIAGLFISYLIPIVLLIRKRLLPANSPEPPLKFGPFRLGHTLGLATNIYSVFFLIISVFFSFFPPAIDPLTLQGMNWSCVVFGGVVILGLCWFAVRGRKSYRGPVIERPLLLSTVE